VSVAKSERTRAAIVGAAMELFRERGYEKATMRAVAAAAGVSVGNAYYYFASKEELVQGLYMQLADEHRAAARRGLARTTDLEARLRGTLRTWLVVAAPYQEFAGRFFAVAAQPDSPLSPFSPESDPAREASIALFAEVVAGSSTAVDAALASALPELLWLYHLGIVLFWVHDRSEGTARTVELIERTTPVVARLIKISRLPVMRPLAREVVDLVTVLRT
jgi:AcrR family transcriptional regulator